MPWNNMTGIDTVDDLFQQLLSLSKTEESLAWRGQADARWLLETSLDRLLDPKTDYVLRLDKERTLIENFSVRAGEHLGETENQYLNGSHTGHRISALAVLQHYHAPTRLLDWTNSGWIALYFAAVEHLDKPGAIWWFKQKCFEQEVGRRWREVYDMERSRRPGPNGQIDLDSTAFSTNGQPWITKLHYPIPFRRIEVQQGFFTVAGLLGLEHGALIADVLDRGNTSGEETLLQDRYGRITVPALWKQDILNRLRTMNIHSRSLDYPGADLTGIDLADDLRRSRFKISAGKNPMG